MTVTATSTTDPITDATQLAPLRYLLPPVGPGMPGVTLSSAYRTDISVADSGCETRRSLRKRPVLRVSFPVLAQTASETPRLRYLLARMGESRFLAPLSCDTATLASTAASGQADIVVDELDYRRFEVGGRVAVFSWVPGSTSASAFEVGVIDALDTGTDTITLTGNLSSSWSSASYVVPLIECELTPTTTMNLTRWDTLDATFSVRELAGENALSNITTAGSNPSGYDTASSLPILDLSCIRGRSMTTGWLRPGQVREVGLGSRPFVFGTRPSAVWSGGLYFETRAEAWSYLTFAHSRAGSAYPFWLFDPAERLDITTLSTGQLTMPAHDDEDDWDFRPYIGVVHDDDSMEVVSVDSVSRMSGVDTVTFGSSLGSSDYQRVYVARLARYDADSVDETWTKAGVCQVGFSARELIDDATTTEIVGITATVDLDAAFDAESCEPQPLDEPDCCAFYGSDTIEFDWKNYDSDGMGGSRLEVWQFGTLTYDSSNSTSVTFSGTTTENRNYTTSGEYALQANNDISVTIACNSSAPDDVEWQFTIGGHSPQVLGSDYAVSVSQDCTDATARNSADANNYNIVTMSR